MSYIEPGIESDKLVALEQRVLNWIDQHQPELIETSLAIHAHPETAYQEKFASSLLAERLEEKGFQVERNVAGLETAFVGRAGSNNTGPTIALLAEYDALPEIGHACGHNLIATAALGAGIALRQVLDELPGQVLVVGTPAEEGGGGKVVLVNNGAFEGVDAALMFHPGMENIVHLGSLASTRVEIIFRGKASHGATAPDRGINALDGVLLTFSGINAMRQHLRDDARVMGIITNGGKAANIIPDYASAAFSIRAADREYADEVLEKFRRCAEGAALATGATMEFKVNPVSRYDNLITNPVLADLFASKLTRLGLPVKALGGTTRVPSTDMGNVSHSVPAIHPYIAIAPVGIDWHTPEFCEAAGSPAGQQGMIQAARALALTGLELLARPQLLQKAKEQHKIGL